MNGIATMTRLLWVYVLTLLFVCLSCTVSFDAADEQFRFSCSEDADCIGGFRCLITGGDEVGQCVTLDYFDREDCADRDNDGYLAGQDCPSDVLDCNDDPDNNGALINPGRPEECNSIDDNCDGNVDEDVEVVFCSQQFGVCAGSVTSCVDGAFQDCTEAGLYGPDYQAPGTGSEACDNLDNDCDGETDEDCECQPGDVQACGQDLGICGRGIQICGDDFEFSPCLVADEGPDCTDEEGCETGFCVRETLNPAESLDDDCARIGDTGCARQLCRALVGDTECVDSTSCSEGHSCQSGFCQAATGESQTEVCNGLDDDCDGQVDDFGSGVCDTCPFGMVFVSNVGGSGRGFCIDAYEASRPDATDVDSGTVETYAIAQADVIPWTGLTPEEAEEVCEASELRTAVSGAVPQRFLCTREDLETACGSDYPYGSEYDAEACIEGGTELELTGSSDACCTEAGVCDLAGNAAELIRFPAPGLQGGAVTDSGADAIACERFEVYESTTIDPGHMGFRCCMIVN